MSLVNTPTEKRYIDICTYKILNDKLTNDEIADNLSFSRHTIDRAVAWGKQRGIFRKDVSARIEIHINECKKHIKWLIGEIERLKPSNIQKQRADGIIIQYRPGLIARLSRELREQRKLLMELEGVYNKTVNVNHTGNVGITVVLQNELSQDYK